VQPIAQSPDQRVIRDDGCSAVVDPCEAADQLALGLLGEGFQRRVAPDQPQRGIGVAAGLGFVGGCAERLPQAPAQLAARPSIAQEPSARPRRRARARVRRRPSTPGRGQRARRAREACRNRSGSRPRAPRSCVSAVRRLALALDVAVHPAIDPLRAPRVSAGGDRARASPAPTVPRGSTAYDGHAVDLERQRPSNRTRHIAQQSVRPGRSAPSDHSV
jgi:hypothetical protein